jgi:hypothetical protein
VGREMAPQKHVFEECNSSYKVFGYIWAKVTLYTHFVSHLSLWFDFHFLSLSEYIALLAG